VTLSGTNTFTGLTNIVAGTLLLGSNLALQDSTLSYNVGNGNLSFGTLTNASLGGLTGNRTIDLENTSNAGLALTVGNNNSNTTYTGILTDNASGSLSGHGSLIKAGTGILTLTGINTYTGGTTITGGLINFSSNSAAQFGPGLITLAGGGLQYNPGITYDMSQNLTLGVGNDTIDTNINNIAFNSVLAGTGTLVKAGAGTLILSSNDTYSNGTIITNGFINFNNANNFGTGCITLAGGGLQYASATVVDISQNIAALNLGNDTIDTGTKPDGNVFEPHGWHGHLGQGWQWHAHPRGGGSLHGRHEHHRRHAAIGQRHGQRHHELDAAGLQQRARTAGRSPLTKTRMSTTSA